MLDQILCDLADIADPGCKGPFTVAVQGAKMAVFLYRKGGKVWGWVDSCPHAQAPLEMEPDRFLNLTGEYLLCSLHGAHFDPKTGECVLGPCRGRSLGAYPVLIRNGKVIGASPT
ncbi:MAG: Rieske 2Fe-2S domain-containing protein [Magnetospirillum sp.]|nr:Rieske 2Fe-2S domain-containing protein [Magnetospirillum sp.]